MASTRILLQKFHLELSPGLVGFKKAADFENSVGSKWFCPKVFKKKTEKSEEFAQVILFQSTNAWNSLFCKKQNHPSAIGFGCQATSPVDGNQKSGRENQLRLVVYSIVYDGFYTSKRWLFGISEPSTVSLKANGIGKTQMI